MHEDFVSTDFKKTFSNDGFQLVQAASTVRERVRGEEVSAPLEGSICTTRRAQMRTEVERSVQLSSTIASKINLR